MLVRLASGRIWGILSSESRSVSRPTDPERVDPGRRRSVVRKKGTFRSGRDSRSALGRGRACEFDRTPPQSIAAGGSFPFASRPFPSGRPRLNPISTSNLDSEDVHDHGSDHAFGPFDSLMSLELPEPSGAGLREAATASAILEALRTDSSILGPTASRMIPMLTALRSLASLPGGIDRPRPRIQRSLRIWSATSAQACADPEAAIDADLGRRNRSRSRSIRPRRRHIAR